jgi:hypothetical protein
VSRSPVIGLETPSQRHRAVETHIPTASLGGSAVGQRAFLVIKEWPQATCEPWH